MEYTRILRPSEAKYKYLPILKDQRDLFPPKDEIFKINFKGKSYRVKVNNKDWIMITRLYETHEFAEGDKIKLVSKKDGLFEMTVNTANSM